jgi:hypothetical protein
MDLDIADAGDGVAQTYQTLAIQLIGPAEIMDNLGYRFIGLRMAEIMGQLIVFHHRAILILSFGSS